MDPKPAGLSLAPPCAGDRERRAPATTPARAAARDIPVLAATWPEGRLCDVCYYDAVHTRVICPECRQDRPAPGLRAADGQPTLDLR